MYVVCSLVSSLWVYPGVQMEIVASIWHLLRALGTTMVLCRPTAVDRRRVLDVLIIAFAVPPLQRQVVRLRFWIAGE